MRTSKNVEWQLIAAKLAKMVANFRTSTAAFPSRGASLRH
jgi:hypothetical protein